MKLDLTSLRSALAALEKSLGFLNSELAENRDLREQFRAAAVQAFEFTHELAFKMLKRQLGRMTADPAAIDQMAYMDVVRTGAQAGLVADVARFRDYREKRNITSHTYDQAKAAEIEAVLNDFRNDVRCLLAALERHNCETD
jgi:nucleotidyltransferase substrate binding protein (TIGR01987 family)